jgi:hypothetical protein
MARLCRSRQSGQQAPGDGTATQVIFRLTFGDKYARLGFPMRRCAVAKVAGLGKQSAIDSEVNSRRRDKFSQVTDSPPINTDMRKRSWYVLENEPVTFSTDGPKLVCY